MEMSGYSDWPEAEKGEAFQSIFNQIYEYNRGIYSSVSGNCLRGLGQYLGRGMSSTNCGYLGGGGVSGVGGGLGAGGSSGTNGSFRVNLNITASVIDTVAAKLASIKTTPQAVTCKGNVKGRRLADDLNFIIKGMFHKLKAPHLINLAYKDAMINRNGYLKVIKEDNDISLERVFADEIIIDQADGFYNKPYKMIHRKNVPLHVMLKKYPKYKEQLNACDIIQVQQYASVTYTPCIVVAEAWCLNTYIEKGRHVISVETVDLLDEDWDKDYFPVQRLFYNEPQVGWIGQSMVDEAEPIQREIDRIMVTIQAILKLVSVPRVFIDVNSLVNKNHVTNKVGLMLEYDGKQGVAPIIHNGAAMPPELMQTLQFLVEQLYARVGLTPMDTQGMQKTGSGNQSGEALKTMTDIKSERWQLLQDNYEASYVELADIILKELQGTNIKISALDRSIGLKEISTKKIPKTDDSYVLKMFPVSSLPDSIPDLIDSVSQMLQLGVIQPSQVPDLFQMPDLDAFVSLQSAPRKLVDKRIEDMMDGGKYYNPEPYWDLDYALGASLQHYSWAQLNDASEKTQAVLRRFINDVKSLLAQRAPIQPPMPQGAPNGATASQPGANPGAAQAA